MEGSENMKPIVRLFALAIVTFMLVKFGLRPLVLKNEIGGVVEIFVLSYPNFCEAIAGTFVITAILLRLNVIRKKRVTKPIVSKQAIYLIATILAAIYVLLQEFKIHNLGGKNTYDPYDVLFSVVGLVSAYLLLFWFKPEFVRN